MGKFRYIVKTKNNPPFFAVNFDSKNSFIDGMIVFDLFSRTFTEDGINWTDIKSDYL